MLKSLARDPIVRVTVFVWLLASALYVLPDFPAAWLEAFSNSWLDVPFLPLAALACFIGIRQLDTAAEQRFWRLWGLSFAVQLAVSLPYNLIQTERSTFGFDLYSDFGYLVAFLLQVLALETRPHERHTGTLGDRQRRLMSAGLVVFGAFLLAYFVLVPAEFDRKAYESAVPSFHLYVVLDAVVLGRLIWMRRETWSVRWAVLYTGLAAAASLTLAADIVELSFRRLGHDLPSSTVLDLLWTTPPALFAIAVRARALVFPAGQRVLNETEPSYPAFRAGHVLLLCAITLPLADYVMDVAGLIDHQTESIRDVIAMSSLVALGGFTLIAYRILDRAREHMEQMERRLLHELSLTQKMDAVSRLAASVAHDFNNLVHVIQGRTELISHQVDHHSPVQEDLREIRLAASRAGDLASELLAFGRQQPTRPVLIDLHDVVSRGAELLRPLLDSRTTIDLRLGAAASTVRIDPLQFERALLNLGANARDAMPDGGTLTLHTANPPIGQFAGHPTFDRSRVLLRICDTGLGIGPDTIDRIFEPFFTTKGKRGSGLGLAIVHGLIQQSGGSISVESELGRGATFTISLPVMSGREPEVGIGALRHSASAAAGAVLIVDGDTTNRQLLRRLLGDLDRPILQAVSAAEALAVATGYGQPIALVVADAASDGARGIGTSLRRMHPDIKAVWLAQDHSVDAGPDDVVLREPFELGDVLAAARRLLGLGSRR